LITTFAKTIVHIGEPERSALTSISTCELTTVAAIATLPVVIPIHETRFMLDFASPLLKSPDVASTLHVRQALFIIQMSESHPAAAVTAIATFGVDAHILLNILHVLINVDRQVRLIHHNILEVVLNMGIAGSYSIEPLAAELGISMRGPVVLVPREELIPIMQRFVPIAAAKTPMMPSIVVEQRIVAAPYAWEHQPRLDANLAIPGRIVVAEVVMTVSWTSE
jgi:hypothetical protein